jgi:hypothetical protein
VAEADDGPILGPVDRNADTVVVAFCRLGQGKLQSRRLACNRLLEALVAILMVFGMFVQGGLIGIRDRFETSMMPSPEPLT